MARADVIQLVQESHFERKAGAHQLMALLSSVHRRGVTGITGVSGVMAQETMQDWGFSASAITGMTDIYNALNSGTINREDLDNALMLLDSGALYHKTVEDFADRLGF